MPESCLGASRDQLRNRVWRQGTTFPAEPKRVIGVGAGELWAHLQEIMLQERHDRLGHGHLQRSSGFSLLCREDEPPLLTDAAQVLPDLDLRKAAAAFGAEPPQHDHQPIAIEYLSKLTAITDGCLDQVLAEPEELLCCDPCFRVRLVLALQLRDQRYQNVWHLTWKHHPEGLLEPSQVQMSSNRTDGFGEVGNVVREVLLGYAVERRLG